MENFYLDCGGLTYQDVIQLKRFLKSIGIDSNIAIGSLNVNTTRENFIEKCPNLAFRVLAKDEKTTAENFKDKMRIKN
jgi:hypothetical protein